MTNELGRELTAVEAIAVAAGQTTIMDIVHGVALEMDVARDAEVHTVMPSGTVITRGELWREMHRPIEMHEPCVFGGGRTYVIGVNASTNMFV